MHRRPRAFAPGASSRGLFLAAALLAIDVPAHADDLLKEKPVSSELGGFLHGTGRRRTEIAGDQSRTAGSSDTTGRSPEPAAGGSLEQ